MALQLSPELSKKERRKQKLVPRRTLDMESRTEINYHNDSWWPPTCTHPSDELDAKKSAAAKKKATGGGNLDV